jgi:hypothetical protein
VSMQYASQLVPRIHFHPHQFRRQVERRSALKAIGVRCRKWRYNRGKHLHAVLSVAPDRYLSQIGG